MSSKAKYKPQVIVASLIVSMAKYNYGRHENFTDTEKERNELAVSIAESGYSIDQPMKVIKLETDEAKAEALAELEHQQKFFDGLSPEFSTTFKPKNGDPDVKCVGSVIREAWNLLHVKNGKLIQPTHANVFGYQRVESFPYALAYKIAKYGKDKTEVFDVPCNVMQYATDAERVVDCINENVERNLGLKDATLHWPSLFKMGLATLIEVYNGVANENQIQSIIGKSHRGIMVTKLLKLDQRFPNLGIANKILNAGKGTKGEDLGHAFVESLDRLKLTALENATSETPRADNELLGEVGDTGESKEAAIAAYLADPKGKAPVKMFTKAAINEIIGMVHNKKVKYILRAVVQANAFAIYKLNALKDTDDKEMDAVGLTPDALPTK